ncbi:MAG: LD-carboxypeptidase [Bacteroidales bacterium]|nr:LD-carboxypeptidase [Bacteroidales bacterium]
MTHSKLIAPALRPGDKVGIIAPAGPITEQQAQKAAWNVSRAGYVPVMADGILDKHGYLAGSDEARANQINSLFAQKDVRAIVCARGGYGTTRILDLLDYDLIKSNPKIIGGYSDITALAIAINKMTGLITFHSSMLVPEDNEYTRTMMWKIFGNGIHNSKIACDPSEAQDSPEIALSPTPTKNRCKGTLIGGNLCLLEALIGTKYDFNLTNKILFVEEINEPPYKIDRMLTHLRMCKNFNGLRGIVFGKMKGCEAQGENSLTLSQVINDFCKGLDIPIITNFSFGHVKSRCTLPIGAKVSMNVKKRELTLMEDVVLT